MLPLKELCPLSIIRLIEEKNPMFECKREVGEAAWEQGSRRCVLQCLDFEQVS